MLQRMRNAQSWMIKGVLWAVVLAFIVTIFYSWGVRSGPTPQGSEVATVLGHRIGMAEFQRVHNSLYRTYQNVLGNRADASLLEQFNFREMALEQIATRYILLRMAEEEGLQVTDAELFERIASLPAFQEQGRFDPARYHAVLRYQVPPITPQQFEAEQRRDLLLEKVYALVQRGMQVTEAEAEEAYRREHEQVAVRYVALVPSLFMSQVTVSDAEAQAHYDSHQSTYQEPEKRQLRYLTVSPERFPFTGEIAQEEIEDYYELHPEAFTRQEEVRVRHILFKVPENASAEQEAQVRTRAAQVLSELRGGADFATFAQQYSEDEATAAKGGDLGLFPRGQMVPAFDEAAFTLSVGQLSELVRTQFGFHILRVEDKVEAGVKPLPDVQQEIITKLRQEKAQEATRTFVEDLMGVLDPNPQQFEALATQHDLALVTTPFIAPGGHLPDLAGVPDLAARAFTLGEGAVDVVASPDGTHYLFQVVAIQPATIPPFAEVQERVKADVQRQKSEALAKQRADDWAARVQQGTPLQELAATLEVQVLETGLFKRNDPIPQFGRSMAFSRVAFDLQVNDAGAAHEGQRHIVMQVTARQAADMQGYAADQQTYRQQLRTRKQQQARMAFEQQLRTQYQQLRQEGKIVVNSQYIF
jgi:peptidyl-prolyl cis-trans isomerase D